MMGVAIRRCAWRELLGPDRVRAVIGVDPTERCTNDHGMTKMSLLRAVVAIEANSAAMNPARNRSAATETTLPLAGPVTGGTIAHYEILEKIGEGGMGALATGASWRQRVVPHHYPVVAP